MNNRELNNQVSAHTLRENAWNTLEGVHDNSRRDSLYILLMQLEGPGGAMVSLKILYITSALGFFYIPRCHTGSFTFRYGLIQYLWKQHFIFNLIYAVLTS